MREPAAMRSKTEKAPVLDLWRQTDFFSQADARKVNLTMIGAGGIGSPTVQLLSKMGIDRITVYDYDSIERHNIPNQIYKLSDIGRTKVEALADVCLEFAGCQIIAKNEKVTKDHSFQGLIVSGVDSMAARKEIWEAIRYNPHVPMYIEARTGGEVLRVHAVRPCHPEDIAWYETTLYDDSNAVDLPCTGTAILYNLFMTAAILGRQIAKYIRGGEVPREIIFDIGNMHMLIPTGKSKAK